MRKDPESAIAEIPTFEDTGGAGEFAGSIAGKELGRRAQGLAAAREMALTHIDQDLRQALEKNSPGQDKDWRCIGAQVSACEKKSFNWFERFGSWLIGHPFPSFDVGKYRDYMREWVKQPQDFYSDDDVYHEQGPKANQRDNSNFVARVWGRLHDHKKRAKN